MAKKSAQRTRPKFRIGILLFISFIVLGVTFAAYMLNTDVEQTLCKERGKSIVTHDYIFDTSSQAAESR